MRMRRDGSRIREASARPRDTIAASRDGHRVLLGSPDSAWLYWRDPETERERAGPLAATCSPTTPSRRVPPSMTGSPGGRDRAVGGRSVVRPRAGRIALVTPAPGPVTTAMGSPVHCV